MLVISSLSFSCDFSPLLKYSVQEQELKNMTDEIDTLAFKMDCLIVIGSAIQSPIAS